MTAGGTRYESSEQTTARAAERDASQRAVEGLMEGGIGEARMRDALQAAAARAGAGAGRGRGGQEEETAEDVGRTVAVGSLRVQRVGV